MALIYDYKKKEKRVPDEPGTDPSDPRYWEYDPPGAYHFPEMKVPVMLILAICCFALSLGLMLLLGFQFWLIGWISPSLFYASIGSFGGCAALVILHKIFDPPDAI